MVGISIWFVSLSAFAFSSFNWQFFDSLLHDNLVYNGVAISMQSLIIGVLVIIILGLVIVFTYVAIFKNMKISNKLYFVLRNSAFLLMALSWFAFLLSAVAFGSLGGDVDVLVRGLFGFSLNDDLQPYLIEEMGMLVSNTNGSDVWNVVKDPILNATGLPSLVVKPAFINIWDNGKYLGLNLGSPLKTIIG